jgi:hypothetical protein
MIDPVPAGFQHGLRSRCAHGRPSAKQLRKTPGVSFAHLFIFPKKTVDTRWVLRTCLMQV